VTYFALGFPDIHEAHKTSLALLIGFSGALGLHKFLVDMDNE